MTLYNNVNTAELYISILTLSAQVILTLTLMYCNKRHLFIIFSHGGNICLSQDPLHRLCNIFTGFQNKHDAHNVSAWWRGCWNRYSCSHSTIQNKTDTSTQQIFIDCITLKHCLNTFVVINLHKPCRICKMLLFCLNKRDHNVVIVNLTIWHIRCLHKVHKTKWLNLQKLSKS